MLKESSGKPEYMLPRAQTPAEYEADSNELTGWLLKTCLVGELGLLAASMHGWQNEWALILATSIGLAIGLFIPNPVRFFRRRGGLTNMQAQGMLWVMLLAHLLVIAAIYMHLHPGD